MKQNGWLGLAIIIALASSVRGDDWPQWMGPNRDDVWNEKGIIDKFPEGGPKVLWRKPVSVGYAGPAVANGKVYVPDFLPETPIDFPKMNNPAGRPKIKGKERILCLDAKTGNEIWKYEYDCPYEVSYPGGPRCTPTVHDGKVYALGAMGNLYCLDAEKGTPIWSKDFKKDYQATIPIWGVCGHPLVDGDKLICVVGGPDATVVAFDRNSGKEIWKALNAKHPGYAPPTIIEAGGTRQLLIWDGNNLNSLNPDDGKVYWAVEISPGAQMSIMAPRKSGEFLFASGMGGQSKNGAMLKLAADKPEASEAWRATARTGVNPINMTPFMDGETMYGVDQSGNMAAVDIKTGKRLWETPAPVSEKPIRTGTAFIVKNGDRYFLFNEKGELVIAKMTPEKYTEISRAKILEPTNNGFGRAVVWMHPAFANQCVYARNDKEIVCVSLAAQ